MIEIDLKEIKSMEELKKELGNKYDEVMYKMNLELLERMDKAVEYIEKYDFITGYYEYNYDDENDTYTHYTVKEELLEILKGSDKK